MTPIIDHIGNPETDRFWVEIEKYGGDWVYKLRTKSLWTGTAGAEVARFNAWHIAQAGDEGYLR